MGAVWSTRLSIGHGTGHPVTLSTGRAERSGAQESTSRDVLIIVIVVVVVDITTSHRITLASKRRDGKGWDSMVWYGLAFFKDGTRPLDTLVAGVFFFFFFQLCICI